MFVSFSVLQESDLSANPELMEYCQELYNKNIRSPYLLAFMVDFYEDSLDLGTDKKEETLQKALEVSHNSEPWNSHVDFLYTCDTLLCLII